MADLRDSTTTKPTLINSTESQAPAPQREINKYHLDLLIFGWISKYSPCYIPRDIINKVLKTYLTPSCYGILLFPNRIINAKMYFTWTTKLSLVENNGKRGHVLIDLLNAYDINKLVKLSSCLDIDCIIKTTQYIVVAPKTNISTRKQRPVPKNVSFGVLARKSINDEPLDQSVMKGFDPVKKYNYWASKMEELNELRPYIWSYNRYGLHQKQFIITAGHRHRAMYTKQIHYGDKITMRIFDLDKDIIGISFLSNNNLILRSNKSQLGEPEPQYEKFDLKQYTNLYLMGFIRDDIYERQFAEVTLKVHINNITRVEQELKQFYQHNPCGPRGRYWDIDLGKPYEFVPGGWLLD